MSGGREGDGQGDGERKRRVKVIVKNAKKNLGGGGGVSYCPSGIFLAILGRGPRAFQIGKISAANHLIGKFSKQTIRTFSVNLKTN